MIVIEEEHQRAFEKGYEQAVNEILIHLRAEAYMDAHRSVYDRFCRVIRGLRSARARGEVGDGR